MINEPHSGDQSFSLTTLEVEGVTVVKAAGEVGFEAAEVLRNALESRLTPQTTGLIADLSEVHTLNALGVAALAEAHLRAQAAGAALILVITHDSLVSMLRSSQIDQLLPMHPTVGAALASLASSQS